MVKNNLVLVLIFICALSMPDKACSQIVEYILEIKSTPDDIGKDRKAWNPDPAVASESYQYNFDIPDEHPDNLECISLIGLEIEIVTLSETNNMGSGCSLGYFSHLLTCSDFGHFVCPDDVVWDSGGFSTAVMPLVSVTDEKDLEDIQGTTIGFDIVPVVDAFNPACELCSITAGDFDASYELTVTLIYEYDTPEDIIDLPDTDEYCNEPNTDYEYKGPNGFELYEWFDIDDNLISSNNRRDFEVPSPGTYTLRVTDDNGCTQEETIEFIAIQAPRIEFTQSNPLTGCGSAEDTVYAIIDGVISNPDYNFRWETPGGNAINQSELILADTGSYLLEVSASNLSCDFFDSFRYNKKEVSPARITNLDSMDLVQASLCEGESLALMAFVPYLDTVSYSYAWINGLDPTRNSVSRTGKYYLQMEDASGCPPSIDSIDIFVSSPLSAGDDNNQVVCPSANFDLTDYLNNNTSTTGLWRDLTNNLLLADSRPN